MIKLARFRLLFLLVAPLALSACTTLKREPAVPQAQTTLADPGFGTIRFLVTREVAPFAQEAIASQQKEIAYLASQGQTGPLPPAYYLAISGGGDNGAFGAGLLNGWTASGTRPTFKIVTGISTGALTAPFAFLGSGYDKQLEQVYTTISQADILKKRGLIKGVFSDAMADTTPLMQLIRRMVDRPLLDAIAAEYAKGRLLLVATTDLDTLEPVVWNMTAIAASPDPRAPELFRHVLVASASIPGIFPPVMIDVSVDGTPHQEMHADGGTVAQVFFYPPSLRSAVGDQIQHRQRTLYVIRNARLDPDWADVQRKALSVAIPALSSLTQTQGIGDLYRIFATTQRDGIDFNLAYIPRTFTHPHPEDFDKAYMQDLFATGRNMGFAGYPWQKFPPGYEGVP
jgi:predicted acylesterase/phospholipase RssA